MRYLIHFVAVLVFSFSLSVAEAQNKVVVVPLNSAKKFDNVVTVSAKGGDFTDPVAAVNSISGATEANPYLVFIGPGVYTLTQTLVMKPYVTIAGSGQNATILTGAISSESFDSAIVRGADNATLCNLAIKNTGGGEQAFALYNDNSSPIINNVTAIAFGGTFFNYGVLNGSSSARLTHVIAEAYGGTSPAGVYNGASQPIMTDVVATASGGSAESYGVFNYNSSAVIKQSTLTGSVGIYVNLGSTKVIRSSIIGAATIDDAVGTTSLTCVYSDNGTEPLNSGCQVP